jgi:hypothetical protein
VQEPSNELERLRSEITALKLELATLTSAIRELQHRQSGHRLAIPANALKPEPPLRPSLVPAVVVVLLAVGLLSWRVSVTPRAEQVRSVATGNREPEPGNREPASGNRSAAIPDTGSRIPNKIVDDKPFDFAQGKPTVYKGTLSVRADHPDATVFVNRRNVGTAPVRVNNLRAGAHLVWVERDGYRRWTRVVNVPAETVTRVDADLEPEPVIEEP